MLNERKQTERRYDKRTSTELPVILHSRNNPPVLAQMCNLSRGGAFIIADGRLFPRTTMLYLDFGDRCKYQREEAIVQALVIRGEAQGVGVMFKQELPDMVYREIVGHNFSQSPPPTAAYSWRHVDW